MTRFTVNQDRISVKTQSKNHEARSGRDQLASSSLWFIFALTCGLYAWLMLWDNIPPLALAFLALLWAIYLGADRWRIQATPMDVPILGLLILLAVNLNISADPQATLIRVYHLLISFSLFFSIVRLVQNGKNLPVLILSLIVLALGAGLLGLFATEWSDSSLLSFLSPSYARLPRLSSVLPGASINKNTMGGALTFFPTLLLSLMWDGASFKKLAGKYIRIRNFHIPLYTLLLALTFGLVMAVLFLTQSRGAWLGTAVGLLTFLVWKDKRFLWLIPLAALLLFVVVRDPRVDGLNGLLNLLDKGQDASLQGRVDIWARIISLTQDFPITGVGLDALNPVYQTYFNPFLFDEPAAVLYHAHNTLLSVTIEMGIPALILYVSLLSSFGAMAKRAWKHARTINRVLIMGLVCGMISHQVFGIMDAFPLGKNLGITMWIYFAVVASLFVHRDQMVRSYPKDVKRESALPDKGRLGYFLGGLAGWVLLSILAVSLSQWNVNVSLVTAVLAGVFLGVGLVDKFMSVSYKRSTSGDKL